MTVAEIAEKLGCTLEGDGSATVTGLAGLAEAAPGDISFLSNPRYTDAVASTLASAVVVGEDWKGEAKCAVIKARNPDGAFSDIAIMLFPQEEYVEDGIHPTAVVSKEAEIGDDVRIGPNCVIEKGVKIGDRTVLVAGCYVGPDVKIGSDCRFYSNVSVREETIIGDRVILHNGAVIGSDGFGNYIDKGKWRKIPQVGIVVIGNDVEIGANSTVDRARFGKTIIGDNARLDNLVQIAHNVVVGENTAMAALTGISGSTKIGKNVLWGGQSGATGHLNIADGTIVAARALPTKDTTPGSYVYGFPAMPYKKAAKLNAYVMRLGALNKRIKELENKIHNFEAGKE